MATATPPVTSGSRERRARFVVNNSSGFTKLPSAIFLALFAWLATRVVAKYGFDHPDDA